MIEIPEVVKNSLPIEVVEALENLGDDIVDITAAIDIDTGDFIGLGHIVNGKFERYNFDKDKNEYIKRLEYQYLSEFIGLQVNHQGRMTYYPDLGMMINKLT